MARADMYRDRPDDDDELEPDQGDEPEDDENGDDADAENGDDDEQDEDADDPEGRAAPAPLAVVAEPAPTAAPVSAAVGARAAPGATPPFASEQTRAARVGTWLPLSDDRVGYVLVYRAGQSGSYLCRLTRPFPVSALTGPLERWLYNAYGPGRYRLLERGRHPERAYLGSLTLTVGDAHAVAGPELTPANGNGNGAYTQAAPVAPGTDYRLALVTVGLPLLAGAMTEFARAMAARPQSGGISDLLAVAKLLQTPNEERTGLVREGMKLYRELAESVPRGDGGGDFNVRDILSGVGELLRSWRAAAPTAAPAPAPTAAGPAAPTAAAELQAWEGENAETFVERVIVTEIQRAVGSGDSPECLVLLIESWLPSHVVAWLESAPDEEVLAELPKKFPAHAEVLNQVGVQQFLRSALQMLREDPDQPVEVPRVREPAHAVAAG